jgi:hypothetical protein
MASRSALASEIVQPTGNLHGSIRHSVGEVAEVIFGNATDLDPGNSMLDADPHTR